MNYILKIFFNNYSYMGNGERRFDGPGIPDDGKRDETGSKEKEEEIVWPEGDRFDYKRSGKAVSLQPDALDPDVAGVYWGPEQEGSASREGRKKLYQVGQFVPYGHTSLYGSLSNTQDREDNVLFQEHLSAGWITLRDDGFVLEEGAVKFFNAILERRSRAIRRPPGAPEGGAGRKDVRPAVEAKERYKEGDEVNLSNTPFGDLTRFEKFEREIKKLIQDGILRVAEGKYFLTSKGADYFNQQHQHNKVVRASRTNVKFGTSLSRRTLKSAVDKIPHFGDVVESEPGFEGWIKKEIQRQFEAVAGTGENLLDILLNEGFDVRFSEVKGKKDNRVTHYRVDIRRFEVKRRRDLGAKKGSGEKKKPQNIHINLEKKNVSYGIENKLMPQLLRLSGLFK